MSQKSVIRKGDTTSHGGVVLEGIDNYPIMGTPVACKGHMVSCPKCKGTYPIIEGLPYAPVEGRQMAVEGMKTGCGAELIATQSVHTYEWVPGGTAAMTSLVSGADAANEGSITITSLTVAELPENRDRTDIGVGEKVNLTADEPVTSWVVEPSDIGRINGSGSTASFQAYDQAGVAKITAKGSDGSHGSISFTVLAPVKIIMKRDPDPEVESILHRQGVPDCGWIGQAYLLPSHVNFYNVQVQEIDTPATGTGFFAPSSGQMHGSYVNGVSGWIEIEIERHSDVGSPIEEKDIIYVNVLEDLPKFSTEVPFVEGLYSMDILWEWRLSEKVGVRGKVHAFPKERQCHQIYANGRNVAYKMSHSEECFYTDPSSGMFILGQLDELKKEKMYENK